MRLTKTVVGLVAAAAALALGVPGTAVAVDGSDSGWQQPVHIDSTGGLLQEVSCASSQFCAAIDLAGDAYVFDGSSWSGPTAVQTGVRPGGLSCVSPTFCMAVDAAGDYEVYNGTGWSKPKQLQAATDLTSVSCASAAMCVAGDDQGNVYEYGEDGWGQAQPVLQFGIQAISCVSTAFCMATNGNDSSAYDGQSWSEPEKADTHPIWDLSCGSERSCVAVDPEDRDVVFRHETWSHRHRLERRNPRTTVGVSCASSAFCVVVDTGEHAMVHDGHGFADPERFDTSQQASGGYAAVSCPTTSFCMAVDYAGDAVEYTG